jgi:isoleucyl-tRNA synthetase
VGDKLIIATKLIDAVMKAGKVTGWRDLRVVDAKELASIVCAHPLAALGYSYPIPLLDGDHVTDDAGTGFVHTAPSHGADDYNIWIHHQRELVKSTATTSPTSPHRGCRRLLHQGCAGL